MTPAPPNADPPGVPKGVCVLGIGTDIVHIPDLAQQISTVGSRFAEPGVVFTARELRRAELRATHKGDRLADHLAAVWQLRKLRSKRGLRRSKPAEHPSHYQSTELCGQKSS